MWSSDGSLTLFSESSLSPMLKILLLSLISDKEFERGFVKIERDDGCEGDGFVVGDNM